MYKEAIAELRKIEMPWCAGFLGSTLRHSGPGEGKLKDRPRETKERWEEDGLGATDVVNMYAGG